MASFAGANPVSPVSVDNLSSGFVLEPLIDAESANAERSVFGNNKIYNIRDAGIRVALANRVVIKTSSALTSKQVKNLDANILSVMVLYQGRGFTYFSATLKENSNIVTTLNRLRDRPAVQLVQPDILQNISRTSFSSSEEYYRPVRVPNNLQPYLQALGIPALWKSTQGAGVRLAIIDDGIDFSHPALAAIETVFAFDMQSHQLSAVPIASIDTHGTKVAGVIFAAHNSTGLKGIAPEAQLIAIRQPDTWTSNTLLAFHLAMLADADVINCSWNSEYLLEPIADVVNDITTRGRNGKGSAVVFSAGNEGESLANKNTEANIAAAITVGATDATGIKLSSSNYGNEVDLAVFGSGVRSTAIHGKYHRFSGTSLSAAIVSGLSALLISANPAISLQELQVEIVRRAQNLPSPNEKSPELLQASNHRHKIQDENE